jgi:hypothetical protein
MMIETIFSPGMFQTLFGGICTLFVTALFYAAKLKREAKGSLLHMIAELTLIDDELNHNVIVIKALREEAPDVVASCNNRSPAKQFFHTIRLDLITAARMQLAKLGCEPSTIRRVSQALSLLLTVNESLEQTKALIAIQGVEQTAAKYSASRLQEVLDKDKTPHGVEIELREIKKDIEAAIAAYKSKLDRFDEDRPLFAYMWQ